jgi:sulfhydrogenase subunit beta (sulfur reductase)
MYMEHYILYKSDLEKLFNILKKGRTIVAPVIKNDKTVYDTVKEFAEISNDFIQTARSAKEVVFPRTEKLFGFQKDKNEVAVRDIHIEDFPEVVVWGVRPCDAAGFLPLKAIFNWDYKDKLFNGRVDKTTIIGFSCQKADNNCFCTSVGGNPGNTMGSDILLTMLDGEKYMAEIITPRGRAAVDLDPSIFHAAEEVIDKEKYLADVPVKFKREEISKKLDAFFESDVWEQQSLRCLGCGACAFVCPTCACFDIQDEVHGKNGSRIRCWDSCGFSMFTLHTSGHNPRELQSQRWRQRLLHKFSYMPERLSVYGCTGCGRCSRGCPVDMNILEHLISIEEGRS